MKIGDLVAIVGAMPVFTTGMLLAGAASPEAVRVQLSRWVKTGKVVQVRRGVYCLAEPYRKCTPHAFLVANALKQASYVSLQSALAFHGLIPEHVPVVTSVTTGRPEMLATPLGAFLYRHIKPTLFGGSMHTDLGGGQFAFVAWPEKALLDLLYLEPYDDAEAFVGELRLQHTERIDRARLGQLFRGSGSRKLARALKILLRMCDQESTETL